MIKQSKILVSKFYTDLSAATVIEYAMIATGIAIVIVGGITLLGEQLAAFFNELGTILE